MSKAYSDQICVTEAQFDALVGMELRLECIDGRLVQVPATFAEHGVLIIKLGRIFVDYLLEHNLGRDKK